MSYIPEIISICYWNWSSSISKEIAMVFLFYLVTFCFFVTINIETYSAVETAISKIMRKDLRLSNI